MNARRPNVLRILARYGIVVALLIELIVFSWASEPFLTLENQANVMRQIFEIAIIAAGMTFVILTAGIDLSVGSLVAAAGVSCAAVVAIDFGPLPLRIAAGCMTGVAVAAAGGLVNGLVITVMRLPPFVATLAMMTIARGVVLHATESRTISGLPEGFAALSEGATPIAIMLVVFIGSWLVLMRTVFGRHVYAVGGNAEAARLCGIRVSRVLLKVYAISGALAGLAGVLGAARLNSGYPRAGELAELDAIAAVVVGGASLAGGRGSIWGTLVGALVIGELNNGLSLLHVEHFSKKIVVGVVLVLAAFLDRFRAEGKS